MGVGYEQGATASAPSLEKILQVHKAHGRRGFESWLTTNKLAKWLPNSGKTSIIDVFQDIDDNGFGSYSNDPGATVSKAVSFITALASDDEVDATCSAAAATKTQWYFRAGEVVTVDINIKGTCSPDCYFKIRPKGQIAGATFDSNSGITTEYTPKTATFEVVTTGWAEIELVAHDGFESANTGYGVNVQVNAIQITKMYETREPCFKLAEGETNATFTSPVVTAVDFGAWECLLYNAIITGNGSVTMRILSGEGAQLIYKLEDDAALAALTTDSIKIQLVINRDTADEPTPVVDGLTLVYLKEMTL